MRELTVRTFLETAQAPGLTVRDGMERVPEELRAVVAAYDQLPKLQRAVLMLSYFESVTNSEIAGIVDRSATRVRHELDRGLATLGGDPYAVRAALDTASWHQPTPAEVSKAFQRHARARARRRRRMGLAGVAVETFPAGRCKAEPSSVSGRRPPCAPSQRQAAGAPSPSAPRVPRGCDGCRVTRQRFGSALTRLSTQSASGQTVAARCCGGSTLTPPW